MDEERTVKNITLTYDDGSTEVIEKGLAVRFIEHEDGDTTASFDMVGTSGKDFYMVVASIIQLGSKIGFFEGSAEKHMGR